MDEEKLRDIQEWVDRDPVDSDDFGGFREFQAYLESRQREYDPKAPKTGKLFLGKRSTWTKEEQLELQGYILELYKDVNTLEETTKVSTLDLAFIDKLRREAVVEKRAGSYRQLRDPDDPVLCNYPLEGITYPTNYGYLPGYFGQDGEALDVFLGSDPEGECGQFFVRRDDVPGGKEVKFYLGVTSQEKKDIIAAFRIDDSRTVIAMGPWSFDDPVVFKGTLALYKSPLKV